MDATTVWELDITMPDGEKKGYDIPIAHNGEIYTARFPEDGHKESGLTAEEAMERLSLYISRKNLEEENYL